MDEKREEQAEEDQEAVSDGGREKKRARRSDAGLEPVNYKQGESFFLKWMMFLWTSGIGSGRARRPSRGGRVHDASFRSPRLEPLWKVFNISGEVRRT